MKKVMAVLLLVVVVTATLALVVTSKQAKVTKRITPLYRIRTVWTTKNKSITLKTNYLEGRIFILSFLRYIMFRYNYEKSDKPLLSVKVCGCAPPHYITIR